MIVSSGANKVTNTNTTVSAPIPASSTIKIVQVGKQPQKPITIMQQQNQSSLVSKITSSPALTTTTTSNNAKISTTATTSAPSDDFPVISIPDAAVSATGSAAGSGSTATPNTKNNLKRKLEEMEEELERDRLAMEEKIARIKKMKADLLTESAPENNDNYLENDDTTDT